MSENFDAESTASATNPTWIKDNRGVYICQVALLGGDNDAAPIPTLYRTPDNKAPNTLKTVKKGWPLTQFTWQWSSSMEHDWL